MSATPDLESLLEGIKISGAADDRTIDELAEALRGKLGLKNMAPADLRGIAMQLASVNLGAGGPAAASGTSSLGRAQSLRAGALGGSSSSIGGGGAGLPVHFQRRGRSPAPRGSPSASSVGRSPLTGMFGRGADEKKEDSSARSGRESPRLDPSAHQPAQPSRAPSPLPPNTPAHLPRRTVAPRASSPMPQAPLRAPSPKPQAAPQNWFQSMPTSRASSPAPPRRAQSPSRPSASSRAPSPAPCSPRAQAPPPSLTSRPASPFYSRPGLQEDDADSVFSQSPSRRHHHQHQPPPGSAQSQHRARERNRSRSNSCNVSQMRRGAGEDDDESVQQPQPRRRGHRKSSSDGIFGAFSDAPASEEPRDGAAGHGLEPLHPASLNLPDFGPEPDFGLAPASSSTTTTTSSSAASSHQEPQRRANPKSPPVARILTPPARPLASSSFDAGDEAPVKTGAGKMRRKGGSPDLPEPSARLSHHPSFGFPGGAAIQASVSFDNAHPTRVKPINHSASFDFPAGAPLQTNHHPYHPPSQQQQQAAIPASAPLPGNPPGQFAIGLRSVGAPKSPGIRSRFFSRSQKSPAPAPVPVQPIPPPPPPVRSPIERAASPMEVDTPPPPASVVLSAPFQIGAPPQRAGRQAARGLAKPLARPPRSLDGHPPALAAPAVVAPKPTPPSAEEARRTEEVRLRERIVSLRNEAGVLYGSADYRASIHKYTEAVSLLASSSPPSSRDEKSDTLAVLLSNRAACFLMIGAYKAAVADCQRALPFVSENLTSVDNLSSDSGPMLKVKLLTRLARALLKHGDTERSVAAFDSACQEAKRAQTVIGILTGNQAENVTGSLAQMITEASIGQTDASRLQDLVNKVVAFSEHQKYGQRERLSTVEALGYVNMSLKIGNGSLFLLETKMSLLCSMKRWREAAGFCERLAASSVQFDGVFSVDTLRPLDPIPDAPAARFLTATFFDDVKDESATDVDLKLSASAVAEAVVRVPPSLLPSYVRALRLEERYPAAEAAIRALEDAAGRGGSGRGLQWLPKEKAKVSQTKNQREIGDDMYRVGDYDTAAQQYAACLLIDSDGESKTGETAGGRLHAVLHCNRAACFMANKRFHDAIDECTAALRIHSRYMKAMLRRARCYGRLHRYQEAISEFEHYIELVEEARKSPRLPVTFVPPCLFDGPREVADKEFQDVKIELEAIRKSKRRSEAHAREDANFHQQRANAFHERFAPHFSRAESGGASARQRQENWRNDENSSRRWDPFAGGRPNTGGFSSHQRSKSFDSSQRGQRPVDSPSRNASSDFYDVLGLERSASEGQVKKQYRKLALKYHPDKNSDEGASDTFRLIQKAYETLSDPEKKREYDRLTNRQRSHYY